MPFELTKVKIYFPELTLKQVGLLQLWNQEIHQWNERLNLISRKDIHALEEHHLLPSLSYLKLGALIPGMTVIDCGTGGGLPGLPLAIALPDITFILVDSIAKKINAVEMMVRTLGLSNVRTVCARAETLRLEADFVIGRAVAPFDKLRAWTKGLVSPGPSQGPLARGLLYLKGDRYREEVAEVPGMQAIALAQWFPQAPWALGRYIVYLPAV